MSAALPRQQLSDALTDVSVRGMRIIQLALAGGVLVFACIVAFLFSTRGEAEAEGDASMLAILTLVHGVTFVSMAVAGMIVPRSIMSRGAAALERVPDSQRPRRAIELLRGAILVRLALLEGAAMFGMVVSLLAVLQGHTIYVWNAASAALFVAFAVGTLPTKENLLEELGDWFAID